MASLNLHHLRLFRAVAAEGTVTGAARQLNLSPSALSTQLRTLEDSLGHPLFERRGRGLILTEAGRIALDHAVAIFRLAEDLSATLRNAGGGQRALRVGALATLSRNFQIGFLRPLLGRPDVEIVLRSGSQGELLRGLDSLALDVVLTNLAPPRDAASPYLIHRLDEQVVSLIGTPARLRPTQGDDSGSGVPLATLLTRHPLILPTPETALRATFDALVAQLGIPVRIAAEVDDMAMIRLMVREDAGLAVIPPIVVRDELSNGELVEAGRLPTVVESFLAVTLERRFPNPLLAELLARG
ncbi:LysR family transcriptional regulator [Nitrospirillum viridazoti]|uniref:LysR family transcriptional regulator n=1 Tax=Nitrospirillum viridazoti CBAmc TaxID=1441467 RepID=A0A248K2T7_9PROT|nr:LysR family transcriptional regulator [Nitrospirillum amazonense]ASG25041.1 LysR family transcriptional regulator [Nitrospirillum amazonense CBAmc]TWB31205.1 LysR family transcriptional activator of nhaA [Nitrospirillum amazonense]